MLDLTPRKRPLTALAILIGFLLFCCHVLASHLWNPRRNLPHSRIEHTELPRELPEIKALVSTCPPAESLASLSDEAGCPLQKRSASHFPTFTSWQSALRYSATTRWPVLPNCKKDGAKCPPICLHAGIRKSQDAARLESFQCGTAAQHVTNRKSGLAQ